MVICFPTHVAPCVVHIRLKKLWWKVENPLSSLGVKEKNHFDLSPHLASKWSPWTYASSFTWSQVFPRVHLSCERGIGSLCEPLKLKSCCPGPTCSPPWTANCPNFPAAGAENNRSSRYRYCLHLASKQPHLSGCHATNPEEHGVLWAPGFPGL